MAATPGGTRTRSSTPTASGYASAFTYIAVMTVGLVLIGVLVIAIGRYRERRASRREETVEDADRSSSDEVTGCLGQRHPDARH